MPFPSTPTSGAARRSSRPRRRDAASLLLLVLLPLFLLGSSLAGGRVLAPAQQLQHFRAWRSAAETPPPWDVMMWDDLAQLLPWQAAARRSVLRNRVPLWNSKQACGSPLLANTQTSALSPYWLVFQAAGIARAQAWLAWLQLAAAGAGMYGFLRFYRLCPVPALFGALAYELSGWSLAWIEFPNRHGPVAWLPLALLLLAKSIRGGWRWRIGCAAVVAVSVLSSHLQFEFYLFLGLGAAAIGLPFAALPGRRIGPGVFRRWIASFLVIVLLAVLLAAPQLLPSLELGRHSYRLVPVSWSAYGQRMSFAMPWWWAAQAFVPGFFGYPAQGAVPHFVMPGASHVVRFSADFYEFCLFTGTVPLFLAVNGIRQCRRNPLALFLLALGIVALLLAVGSFLNAPLYFLIPGFSAMAGTARMLFLYSFSIAGLSALGLQAYIDQGRSEVPEPPTDTPVDHASDGARSGSQQRRCSLVPLIDAAIILGAGFAACAGASAYLAHYGGANHFPDAVTVLSDRAIQFAAPLLLLAFTTVCAFLLRQLPAGMLSTAVQILLLGAAAWQLLDFGRAVVRTAPAPALFPASGVIRAIDAVRPFRLMSVGQDWTLDRSPAELPAPPALPPNTATYYDLGSLEGYDSLNSRAYIDYVMRIQGTASAPVPAANGNMVLLSNAGSPLVGQAGVDVVVSAESQSSPGLSATGEVDGLFLYRVRHPSPPAYLIGADGSRAPAQVLEWANGRIVLDRVRGPGRLVVLDAAAAGWSASVDGRSVPVGTAEGLFKSIDLGKGSHKVTLEYRPVSFRLGVFVSALVCSGIAGLLTCGRRPLIRPRPDDREVRRARREFA